MTTTLRGQVNRVEWGGIWGWALDTRNPGQAVELEISDNGEVLGRVQATQPRPWLNQFPQEHRNCGFQFRFRNGLSALGRHVIRVRWVADGSELPGSPAILEPPVRADEAAEQTLGGAVQAAIATAETAEQLDAPLCFIADRLEHLLAARATLPDAGPPPGELLAVRERFRDLTARTPKRAESTTPPQARRVLVIGDCRPNIDFMARGLIAHIGLLRRLGFRVDFAATEFRPEAETHHAAIAQAGAEYLRPPLYATVEEVVQRNRGLFDVIYLHRVTNYERYAELARLYCPQARIVFSVGNLHFLRLMRRAALQRWEGADQGAQILRTKEIMAAWSADRVITHSAHEAEVLRQALPQARIGLVAWPLEPRPRSQGFAARRDIAFIGDYSQHSDLEAVGILIDHVMPEVWKTDPFVQCLLAGNAMPATLRDLKRPNVIPVGAVAEEELFDRVRLTVAPQRYGAGLNPAVVASMAAGVPCAAGPHPVEALQLDESLRRRMVGTDVEQVAALISRLHAEETEHQQVAEAGLRFIAEAFAPGKVEGAMLETIGHAEPVAAAAQ